VTTGKIIETIVILGGVLIAVAMIVRGLQLSATRTAKTELTSSETYRNLAEEYRRLADMAITAQEHTDLKLADVNLRLEQVADQLDSVQRILKDVE
jgi:small-conductance mechanosensitive channel